MYYNDKEDGDYKWTGHSSIIFNGLSISKNFDDKDYNLVTNNCSDATKQALEIVFNKKLNTGLFTTPGNVRDFAIQNGGKSQDKRNRTIIIPMNKNRYERLHRFF
jgi:hypothetical protein